MRNKIVWIIILSVLQFESSLCVDANRDEDAIGHDGDVTDDVRAIGGPERLEQMLNREFIVINGVKTTLGLLFGDKRPTASSLRVGSKIVEAFQTHQDVIISLKPRGIEENYASGSYTPRIFLRDTLAEDYTWTTPLEDTPTAIAIVMVELITDGDELPIMPVIIVGDARSGKSVALAKIQSTLSETMPTLWTIRIDLAEDRYSELTTLDDVVREAVGSDFADLILNVMEMNPRRVVLLIDGADHVTDRRAAEAVSIVKAASERSAPTVLIGRRNILNFIDDIEMQHLTIGEMTFQETEHFLTNAWRPAVESELSPGASTSSYRAEVHERLTYFARALTHTLFKTSLPRQPVTLQVLADLFKDQSTMDVAVLPDYPVTCLDYVFHPSSSAPPLVAALENLALDINILYEKIIAALLGGRLPDLFSDDYGILAVTAMKQRDQSANRPLPPLPQDFERSSTQALLALRTRQAIDPLIDINNDNKVKFCYRGIEDYYAAKYVSDRSHDPHMQAMLEDIFKHNYNYNLLEFLNAKTLPLFPKVPTIFHGRASPQIIQNIIKHGYDDLFVYVYENLDVYVRENTEFVHRLRQTLIDEAFFHPGHIPQKILGMTEVSVEHPNPYARTSQSQTPLTHLQLVIKHNMQKTLELILPVFRRQNGYIDKNLLDAAVTRPVPNLEMVKALMDFLPLEVLEANLNRLLYETVDKVGDGCQQVANYLVERGAQPSHAVVAGSTLVHAAVKSNSVNLLHYVVKDVMRVQGNIEDSRDASGRSIFETALDANASPMFTFPGWWEMMDYLVQHMNPLPLSTTTPAENSDIYTITRETMDSSEFQLMLMNLQHGQWNDQQNNYQILELYPIERQGYSDKLIKIWSRFIPYTRWSFTKNILSLRRLSWLSRLKQDGVSEISPLEMLVSFRGAMALQPAQHMHYRNAVMSLIKRDRGTLDYAIKVRIYTAMWKTVGDTRDLVDTLYHTLLMRPNIPYGRLYYRIVDELIDWHRTVRDADEQLLIPMRERLMQTRVNYVRGREISAEVVRMIRNFYQYMTRLNEGGRSFDLVRCVQRRLRRDTQTHCAISWTDVLKFDDNVESREVQAIRVNSDRFLQVLAEAEQSDRVRAYELVELVRELQFAPSAEGLITGSSRMLVQDVLGQGSLSAYRQNRRIADLTAELWHSSARPRKFMALLPSRATALYIGSQIPLVHALFAAIDACLQQRVDPSDNRCWYGAGMFGLSVLLGPVGDVAVRYTPRMVDQFSRVTLELLPSKAPAFLRENIYIVRNIGLKYGARALSAGLAIVGIGFDIYNIVTMSQAIDECNREPDFCTSRDRAEYIISLTFSCVSMVVTGGLMITGVGIVPAIVVQLHLLVLEHLTLGLTDAIYFSLNYHTTFGETFRIFLRKFMGLSQSGDITALVARENLVERLRRYVKKILNQTTNEEIIAYGIAVGSLVSGGGIVAGHSVIDMSRTDVKNSENLSRVMPQADSDTIRLCLPQEESAESYNDYAHSVPTAKYRCVNSFVLAHRKRWESGITDKSYIIYDLRYIKDGLIVGSNTINNLFLIHNGTANLSVKGGSNITNNYIIHETSFRGSIQLHDLSLQNILNLAIFTSLQAVPRFKWHAKSYSGHVCFENTLNSCFQLNTSTNATPNLYVIGRAGQAENYYCDYTNRRNKTDAEEHSISIDGNGGESVSSMDKIVDCRVSIVRPFTHIIGSESPDETHTARVHLEYVPFHSASSIIAPVVIEPRRSKFIIIFENQSLLANILRVTYNTSSKIVSWNFSYTLTGSMLLSVTLHSESNSSEINYIIIDSYSGGIIYPIIEQPANTSVSTVDVQNLHIFIAIDTSRLSDVISRYRNLTTFWNSQFFIVTKFTHSQTGKTFVFGSKKSEHFYIDANTTFLYGSDGHDVYVLSPQAPKYIQIDNRAMDRALDTLIILNSTCKSLSAKLDSLILHDEDSELLDVTLFCATDSKTSGVNIVLKNYLIAAENRHLKIFWDDTVYVLLPTHWTRRDDLKSTTGRDVKLGLVYSFRANLDALTLTSHNTHYLVLNMTGNSDSLLAYRLPMSNNVLITQKNGDYPSTSFVILENFFSADTNHTTVSAEWQQLKIFVTADVDDDEVTPTVLTAEGMLNLIFSTVIEDTFDTATNGDPIIEYFVDMASNETTAIEHNRRTQSEKDDRLGVLAVTGENPGNFRANRSTNDSNSLSLCTLKSCIVVSNWCLSPRHRLYRMELISAVNQRPTVIHDLDELDCQSDSLKKLNDKLQKAQQELALTAESDESDRARLIRCVASVFVTVLPFNVTYKLFEFHSTIDYVSFVQVNCPSLLTRKNLGQLSMEAVSDSIDSAAQKYALNNLNIKEQQSISELREFLGRVKSVCWRDFKKSLYFLYENNEIDESRLVTATFETLNYISALLENCVNSS